MPHPLGWVDDFEYSKLMESLEECLKRARQIKAVQPCPPKVIFQEIPWIADDKDIMEYLYENVRTSVFDTGDVICAEGQVSDGIYIVVTGILGLQTSSPICSRLLI